jgi:cytosine permease
VLVAATVKINDWNLYSASLGVVNFADQVFHRRFNRAMVTIGVGVLGTALAAAGILDHFIQFLTTLGIAVPPIAGIMAAEYWIVRSHRAALDASRATGTLPASAPRWVPASLVIWIAAFLIGKYVEWGIPSLNSLAVAFVAYVVAGRLGLVRSSDERVVAPAAAPAT